MKPPLSNNYCSTVNVADESVCEMPVNKVKRWIDNNDFKHNGDGLLSNSYNSLATSQMFAYICKDEKENNEELFSGLLAGYIDDVQMDKHVEYSKTDNDINDSLLSLYVDEAHLKQMPHLNNANSCQLDSYCEENTVLNTLPHPNQSHTSLPSYIEEQSNHYHHKDVNTSQDSLSSISSNSLTLHHTGIPHVLKDTYSLPDLICHVSNPLFTKGSDLSQYSCSNQTTDSVQMITSNSDSNITDSHDQKQSAMCNIKSSFNTSFRLSTNTRLNPGFIEALPSPRCHELLSNSSDEINCNSDFSASDNQLDTFAHTSLSGIHTSSLGYFELPADNTKHVCVCSRESTRSSLFELDFDIDSQCYEAVTTSNISKTDTYSPNLDLGYMHIPLQTEIFGKVILKTSMNQ